MNRKPLAGVFAVFGSIVLIIVILLSCIQFAAFDYDFYVNEYQELNTAENIGMSQQDLMYSTEQLLSYLNGNRDNIIFSAKIKGEVQQVFDIREIEHMKDVRKLFFAGLTLGNTLLWWFIVLLAFVWWMVRKKTVKYLAWGYLGGGFLFIILLVVAGFAISRDFDGFWRSMHMLIFDNDLWLLDPEEDILIQMVPEKFFFDMVVRVLGMFGIVVGVMTAVCSGIAVRYRRRGGK